MARVERSRGRTVALVGGGALVAWLLLRGAGRAFGRARRRVVSDRLRVRVSDDGITIDGAPVSLADAVARAREAGAAEVVATGAARAGTVDDLVAALRAAGVELWDAGGRRA